MCGYDQFLQARPPNNYEQARFRHRLASLLLGCERILCVQGCISYGSPVSGSPGSFSTQGCDQTQKQSSEISSRGSYSETTFRNAAMPLNITSELPFSGSYTQQLQTPIEASPAKTAGTYTPKQMPGTPPAEVLIFPSLATSTAVCYTVSLAIKQY